MTVTIPKRQRASREPLIWVAIGRSGDRPAWCVSSMVFLNMQGDRQAGNRWLSSLDSTRIEAGEWGRGARQSLQPNRAPNGTFKKYLRRTIAYAKSSITVACYLCNTHRKRRGVGRFGAVPLLRVQTLSVIVMLRRRGASRGRPVLGGSLKSLAFRGSVRKREATKRVLRDKGTNLRVLHPADPEPSLQSNLEV
jgi:hypothetical protein